MSRLLPALAAVTAISLSGCGGGDSTTTTTTTTQPLYPVPNVRCGPRSKGDDPLGVKYDIEYYSGEVSCGNVLLEADIGGGINIAPIVTYPRAREGKFYTFIYVDPDADMAGSWSHGTDLKPGPHAPVRHWVLGNIPGEALVSGDFANKDITTVTSFKGPSPPAGSHRYGQFLFEQPNGTMEFEPLDDDNRINWDWGAFIDAYGLGSVYGAGEPLSMNWHIAQQSKPREANGNTEGLDAIAREALELNCTGRLGMEYGSIEYYNGTVTCGSVFLEADIGGGINVPPSVSFAAADSDLYYTLIYFDPDADMAGSWPNATAPGAHAPVRHWVLGNIPGTDLHPSSTSQQNFTVSAFKGPSPPAGSHRYAMWLFAQPDGKIEYTELSPTDLTTWNYAAFIEQHSLGEAVGTIWHVTQQMEPRSAIDNPMAAEVDV